MPGNGGTQISSIKCDDTGYYIDDLFSCSLRFPNRKNMITRSVTVHRPRIPPGRSSSKVHKIIQFCWYAGMVTLPKELKIKHYKYISGPAQKECDIDPCNGTGQIIIKLFSCYSVIRIALICLEDQYRLSPFSLWRKSGLKCRYIYISYYSVLCWDKVGRTCQRFEGFKKDSEQES